MVDLLPEVGQIAERLDLVRERIFRSCQRVGRDPDDVTLVAVTKVFPLSVVEAAYEAGLRHLGESRVQEMAEKVSAFKKQDVTWHLIGHLQRNKARVALEACDLFHALDSVRLARHLDRHAQAMGSGVPCLVQVNVSGEESKFGLGPDEVPDVLDRLAEYTHLDVQGLMTLAAPTPDPNLVRPQFQLLKRLFDRARERAGGKSMKYLSMGMSGDYEVAIEEGATHIRLGTVLFGSRPVR